MDGSEAPRSVAQTAAEAYDGPPDHRIGVRHAVYPDLTQDEVERFNYLAQMQRHLQTKVVQLVESTYEARVEPKFEAEHGRKPKDRG